MRPSNYQRLINDLAPGVNPAGVEASMRLQYGTLDRLPRETFALEAGLAAAMERDQPGVLRRLADSFGMDAEFEHWEQQL
jgi:hypothetical protein